MARAMAEIQAGAPDDVVVVDATITANLDLFHILGWFNLQLERLADGLDPDLALSGADATAAFRVLEPKIMDALLRRRGRLAA